ncbi:RNA polymerase [Paenibacillus sp. XY044]|nr:RNA polymerase [Paenibacillus sp. XY044]
MRQFGDEMLRTAFLLLRDRYDAEEAVQDSFIQAFRHINQLQDEGKLKSWLIRIVVNRCRMKQRAWSWGRFSPSPRIEEMIGGQPIPGPEEKLLTKWRNEGLSQAIHKLKYIYRESITLYYFNEMSVSEIAGSLQLSENTVKARLARGRQQLQQMLEQEEPDAETRTAFD